MKLTTQQLRRLIKEENGVMNEHEQLIKLRRGLTYVINAMNDELIEYPDSNDKFDSGVVSAIEHYLPYLEELLSDQKNPRNG